MESGDARENREVCQYGYPWYAPSARRHAGGCLNLLSVSRLSQLSWRGNAECRIGRKAGRALTRVFQRFGKRVKPSFWACPRPRFNIAHEGRQRTQTGWLVSLAGRGLEHARDDLSGSHNAESSTVPGSSEGSAAAMAAVESATSSEYMLGPELGAIIVDHYEGGFDEHGW